MPRTLRGQEIEQLESKYNKTVEAFTNFQQNFEQTDISEVKEVKTSVGWFSSLFQRIYKYYFGNAEDKKLKDEGKLLKPEDAEVFKALIPQAVKNIDAGIENLKGRETTDEVEKNIKALADLKNVLTEEKGITEDVYDTMLQDKYYPGAIEGDELRQEIRTLAKYIGDIDGFNAKGMTNDLGYYSTYMRIMKETLKPGEQDYNEKTALDVNNPVKVEEFLAKLVDSFKTYRDKHKPGTANREFVYNKPEDKRNLDDLIQIAKYEFRDELLDSIINPLEAKIKAIQENRKLVSEGKEPRKYQTRNYFADSVFEKYTKFTDLKAEKELFDFEAKKGTINKIQRRQDTLVQALAKDLNENSELNKTDVLTGLQALLYNSSVKRSIPEESVDVLENKLTQTALKQGIKEYKKQAEEYIEQNGFEKLINLAKMENGAELIAIEIEDFKPKLDAQFSLDRDIAIVQGTLFNAFEEKKSMDASEFKTNLEKLAHLQSVKRDVVNLSSGEINFKISKEGLRDGIKNLPGTVTEDFIKDAATRLMTKANNRELFEKELSEISDMINPPELENVKEKNHLEIAKLELQI